MSEELQDVKEKVKAYVSQGRVRPKTSLDMDYLTTNPVWGQGEINQTFRWSLNKDTTIENEKGEEEKVKLSQWDMLSHFTRDMRLANLSVWDGELAYCDYYLLLASDFLQVGSTEAFICALDRVIVRLELSQSKGGFLRKKMNTFTHESVNREEEPPKKSIWGGKRREVGQ